MTAKHLWMGVLSFTSIKFRSGNSWRTWIVPNGTDDDISKDWVTISVDFRRMSIRRLWDDWFIAAVGTIHEPITLSKVSEKGIYQDLIETQKSRFIGFYNHLATSRQCFFHILFGRTKAHPRHELNWGLKHDRTLRKRGLSTVARLYLGLSWWDRSWLPKVIFYHCWISRQ